MEALFGCSMMIKKGVHGNRAGTEREPSLACTERVPSENRAGTERNRAGSGPALQALAGTVHE